VYSVVEDSRVSHALDEAIERWARAQDAWDAVVWTLARHPEDGIALTESGQTRSLTLEGARSIDMPTITVVYEILASVVIRDARFEDAKSSFAGRA
jgi:hypothetical protein